MLENAQPGDSRTQEEAVCMSEKLLSTNQQVPSNKWLSKKWKLINFNYIKNTMYNHTKIDNSLV